jgi:hypothetical protein
MTDVESGAPQESETVNIHEASDADLDAFIAASEGRAVESPAEDETAEPEPQKETKTEASTDISREPEKVAREDQKEKKEFVPPKEEEFLKPDDVPEQATKEDIEKTRRQIEHQRYQLARYGTELGDARKQLKEAKARLSDGLEERFAENPSKAVEDTLKIHKIDEKLGQIDSEEAEVFQRAQSHEILSTWVKPEQWNVPLMAKVLEQDGFQPDFIQRFQQDPTTAAHPETLVQLARRAQDRQYLVTLAQGYRAKEDEVKELKAKLKAQPKDVLQKVNAAARHNPGITQAQGSGTNGHSKSNVNPALMSDAELTEFLKANGL